MDAIYPKLRGMVRDAGSLRGDESMSFMASGQGTLRHEA
jgi:hypothetical protein